MGTGRITVRLPADAWRQFNTGGKLQAELARLAAERCRENGRVAGRMLSVTGPGKSDGYLAVFETKAR